MNTYRLGGRQFALAFAGGDTAAVQQAAVTGFGMAFHPLIDGLPADTHRLGGFGLGLTNGDDEKDRTGLESAVKNFLFEEIPASAGCQASC